ncbi:MAG TPA: hypothetical protein VE684_10385 [Crenalkalicoccus sp.]|jgi:hypothetical protein|nr:hypothetical protein [Crenalkalicoccus sp.]
MSHLRRPRPLTEDDLHDRTLAEAVRKLRAAGRHGDVGAAERAAQLLRERLIAAATRGPAPAEPGTAMPQ